MAATPLAPPDFATPRADGAWYLRRTPGGTALEVCATDAWSVATLARSELAEQVRTLGGTAPPGPEGRPADYLLNETPPADESAAWDASLLRTAWALGAHYRIPADRLAALGQSLASGVVALSAVETVLWMAFESAGFRGADRVYGQGSPDEVAIPSDARAPLYGRPIAPPPDLRGGQSGRYPSCRATTEEETRTRLRPVPRGGLSPFQVGLLIATLGLAAVGGAWLVSRPARASDFPTRARRNPRRNSRKR